MSDSGNKPKRENCCAGTKIKKRGEDEHKKLVNRLNRIEGQIKGIGRMLDNDAYCVDILIQVSAVNAALNSFGREILNSHIKTCVTDDIRGGSDEAVEELIELLSKYMK